MATPGCGTLALSILFASILAAVPIRAQSADASRLVKACRSHIEREEPAAAAIAGRQALALSAEDTEAALCLGIALAMLRQYSEAVPLLERVLVERPEDLDALYGLAEAYATLDEGRAEEMYARLTTLLPGHTALRLRFVEYLWHRQHNEAGNRQMERLLQDQPGQPDLRVTYALELLRQGLSERAALQLEKAEAEGTAGYRVAYLLGNAWWEAGKIERAFEHFRKAIEIDPAAAPARHDLGRLLIWSGRPEAAVEHLEQAAAARDSAVIKFDLGRSYEASGQLDRAERAYREARALEPSLSRAHYALARVLKRTGRAPEAADALQSYQRLHEQEQQRRHDERSRRAELDRSWHDLRHGRTAEALAGFERLGDTPQALLGRATALSRLGRHNEAVDILERAVLLAPDDARVTYLLARERASIEGGAP